MNPKIKEDILSILNQLAQILKVKKGENVVEVAEIKGLSNKVIHDASIFQDEDSISIGVLVYSLSKIIERKQKELDYGSVLIMVNSSISYLTQNDDEKFRKSIKDIFNFIRKVDEKIKLFIHEVINQAKIKKGCKLCEHGISITRASDVMGISQWELMNYFGKTTIIDKLSEQVNVSYRLKIARSLFS